MLRKILFAAASAAALLATPAFAQESFINRIYGKAEIGAVVDGDVDASGSSTIVSPGTTQDGDVLPFGSTDLDAGLAGSLALGVSNFPLPNWRVEAEVWASNNETGAVNNEDRDVLDFGDNPEVNTLAGFANLYYDFNNVSWRGFKPFLGGGVGVAKVEYDGGDLEADDEVFAWNLQAGVGYQFNPALTGQIGYRYISTESAELDEGLSDVETTGNIETDFHAVTAGLIYRFGAPTM